jgi:hypothetical protein
MGNALQRLCALYDYCPVVVWVDMNAEKRPDSGVLLSSFPAFFFRRDDRFRRSFSPVLMKAGMRRHRSRWRAARTEFATNTQMTIRKRRK